MWESTLLPSYDGSKALPSLFNSKISERLVQSDFFSFRMSENDTKSTGNALFSIINHNKPHIDAMTSRQLVMCLQLTVLQPVKTQRQVVSVETCHVE